MSEPLTIPQFHGEQIIVMPHELEGEVLRQVLPYVLNKLNDPIYVFVDGDGGTCSEAQGLVDLFKWHGNVTGILLGSAMSAHVTVWAGCTHRFAFPGSYVGIHKVGSYGEMAMDSHMAQYTVKDYLRIEKEISDLFASVSNRSSVWWFKEMQKAGRNTFKIIMADELINKYEMARPAMELDKQWLIKAIQPQKLSKSQTLKKLSNSLKKDSSQSK